MNDGWSNCCLHQILLAMCSIHREARRSTVIHRDSDGHANRLMSPFSTPPDCRIAPTLPGKYVKVRGFLRPPSGRGIHDGLVSVSDARSHLPYSNVESCSISRGLSLEDTSHDADQVSSAASLSICPLQLLRLFNVALQSEDSSLETAKTTSIKVASKLVFVPDTEGTAR